MLLHSLLSNLIYYGANDDNNDNNNNNNTNDNNYECEVRRIVSSQEYNQMYNYNSLNWKYW